jgi:hypothetical protein
MAEGMLPVEPPDANEPERPSLPLRETVRRFGRGLVHFGLPTLSFVGAAVAVFSAVHADRSLRLHRAEFDQKRAAAHADDPVRLAIQADNRGEVTVLNLSRFPVRNVELEWDEYDYSTACDSLLGSGSSNRGLYPQVHWLEMLPLERRGVTTVDPGSHATMLNRRGCEQHGEGRVYPLTDGEPAASLPLKVIHAATAIPACSESAPCRRIYYFAAQGRHPFTGDQRRSEEFFAGDLAGNLIPSTRLGEFKAGRFAWHSDQDRKMFVRIAEWKSRLWGIPPPDVHHDKAFVDQGLWNATGVAQPSGLP